MSSRNVIGFLRRISTEFDLLEHLKVKSKDDVIATAQQLGCPFTEAEFDSLIWNLEVYLAEKRGETFDARLFSTMWGKYYLEFLAIDLIPSFADADFDVVMTGQGREPQRNDL